MGIFAVEISSGIMNNAVILFLFLASSIVGFGQERWTLEQCVNYAVENNITIKQSELQAQLSEQNVVGAKGSALPTLNGFATHGYNFGQRIDPFTNQFAETRVQSNNFQLSSNWVLFGGLQNYNSIRRSELEVMAAKYDVESTKNDISLQVALAYLRILQNDELLKVAEFQQDIIRQQVDRTERLVKAGSVPAGDLLQIQAQLANEEANVVNAQNQVDLAYLSLKQILQLDASADFEVVQPQVEVAVNAKMINSSTTIYANAEETLPAIKGAEIRVESTEKGIKVAQGSVSPRLSLNGSIGTGFSDLQTVGVGNAVEVGTRAIGFTENTMETVLTPVFDQDRQTKAFNDQLQDNFNQNITVTLNIPIFNGFQNANAISRSKIQNEIAKTTLLQVQNGVKQDIEQAYADAKAALRNYRATEKSLNSLQTAYDYAQKRFEVGMINAVDFNTAKNNLTQAQSNLVRSKYTYVFTMKILDFYMGNPIIM